MSRAWTAYLLLPALVSACEAPDVPREECIEQISGWWVIEYGAADVEYCDSYVGTSDRWPLPLPASMSGCESIVTVDAKCEHVTNDRPCDGAAGLQIDIRREGDTWRGTRTFIGNEFTAIETCSNIVTMRYDGPLGARGDGGM